MIHVSEKADRKLIEYLSRLDSVSIVKSTDTVYPQVSSHPDIYMCSLDGKIISAAEGELAYRYPGNCRFNAACTGKYLIANMDIISPRLKEAASSYEFIHVRQGYAKCSIACIDETHIITSDEGIYLACRDRLDVLRIRSGHIILPGFNYGFIGGTCGRIGDRIIFNGKVTDHPDGREITEFIHDTGLELIEFDYPLTDIGSIIYER